MRDDAHTAIRLSCYLLKLFERLHHRVEALLVKGAEAFVNEEDVDVHVGPIERGQCQRECQGYHEALASGEDGGATHLILVVTVQHKDAQLLVVFTAGEPVAVGYLFQIDVGIVEQRTQNIGLHQCAESGASEYAVQIIPACETLLSSFQFQLNLFQFLNVGLMGFKLASGLCYLRQNLVAERIGGSFLPFQLLPVGQFGTTADVKCRKGIVDLLLGIADGIVARLQLGVGIADKLSGGSHLMLFVHQRKQRLCRLASLLIEAVERMAGTLYRLSALFAFRSEC